MLRRLLPWAIVAAGVAGVWLYAWPGYMSPDSAQQLLQARSHDYSDGHPPLMAALWTVVEHGVKGPAGMLVIQTTSFVVGLFLILRRHFERPWVAAIVAVAITWFPPVLAPMGVIWKDSLMAGLLLLGCGLFSSKRPVQTWLGVFVIALAIGMRHNAAVAALPAFLVFVRPRRFTGKARIASAVGLWLIVTLIAICTNRLLTKHHEQPWCYSTGPADIAGILHDAHPHYSDEQLLVLLDGTPLAAHDKLMWHSWRSYDPTRWWWAVNGRDRLFRWPETDAERVAIKRAWRRLVLRHPYAYLHHRMNMFRYMLGMSADYTRHDITAPVWRRHMDAYQNVDTDERPVQEAVGGVVDTLGTTFLFRPFIYFFICIALLRCLRRSPEPFALLTSGLLYQLTFIPFAPSIEYRYTHWMITCSLIATAIFVKQRIARRRLRLGRRIENAAQSTSTAFVPDAP